MRRRSPLGSPLAAALLTLALAACTAGRSVGYDLEVDPARDRAAAVVRAWDGSADQRTWQHGYYPLVTRWDWVAADFHNDYQRAFLRGQLEPRAALPPYGPAPTATVVWADGSTLALPALGSAESLRFLMDDDAPCQDGCHPIPVTAVRPGTRQMPTSRGQATIPVWEFTLAGYPQAFTYPAVAPQQSPGPTPAPGATPSPVVPGAMGAGWTSVSADGLTLHGSVDLGCTESVSTEVYETDTAVVPIVHVRPVSPPDGTICTGVGGGPSLRDFSLSRPLGARAVLDLSTGLPQSMAAPARGLH
ncbi:hypothetical protein CFP65_1741 [Kitasatospora sp. MMS16-BH015]|uniref:hypothetical protein n=1 Tax=Kitasatospora sp. MMS16-BH015 TaxID=2018025 RepID=UPI000CA30570|nr:hypothetical protein [Kitasatospora sp. MMS16-BH015]AUG76620.1 hypothetical protein CFP65_1741 [Kitasatospora sp. MMS16-BH015]